MLWASCQVNTTPHLKQVEIVLCKVCSHSPITCLSRKVRLQRELIPKPWQFGTKIVYKKQCSLITCTRFHTSVADSHASRTLQTCVIHISFLEVWKSAEKADGRTTLAVVIFQRFFFKKKIKSSWQRTFITHQKEQSFLK